MKFTFEADMKKGKCSACPFLDTKETLNGWWDWSCTLNDEVTTLEVEPSECPLIEESELMKIVWHPYPQEQPKKDGNYIVTTKGEDVQPMTYENGNFYIEYPWVCTSQNDFVLAWTKLPKPYEEET